LTLFLNAIGLDTSSSGYFSVKEALESGIEILEGESEQIQALGPTVSQQVLNQPSCSYSSNVVATGSNGGRDVQMTPLGEKSKYINVLRICEVGLKSCWKDRSSYSSNNLK
jgi:hypothetical protein